MRFVAQCLGCEVEWIGSVQKVAIVYPCRMRTDGHIIAAMICKRSCKNRIPLMLLGCAAHKGSIAHCQMES